MPPPNLFDFATSELSQDAFICWLASWADPEHRASNDKLHATAATFLDRLLEAGGVPKPAEYRSIHVRRQWKSIDVLLVVNEDTAILIEDKTDTKDHSGQLKRYTQAVGDEFRRDRIAAVYLKTGDQGNYRSVEEAGYACFLRRDLLSVLAWGKHAGVKNDIFDDFLKRLSRIEEAVQSFRSVPLAEWGDDSNRWKGFFLTLQQWLGEGEWDQDGHPGGSSVAFRWHWRDGRFLRLLNDELCFRIEVENGSQQAAKWVEWSQALLNQAGAAGVKIKAAPRRLGRRMGVALLDGDYRRADAQGFLDIEQTVGVLKNAETLMDMVLGVVSSSRPHETG